MWQHIIDIIQPQTLQLGLRSGCFVLYFFILTAPLNRAASSAITNRWSEYGWRCVSLAIVFFFTPQHIAALLHRPFPVSWVLMSSVIALILIIAGAVCKNIAKTYEAPLRRTMLTGVSLDLGVVGLCILGAYIFS